MAIESVTVLRWIEEATRTVPGVLRRETPLAALPGWDSLGMVQFMAAVADAGGRKLQVSELRAVSTVGQLQDLVTA